VVGSPHVLKSAYRSSTLLSRLNTSVTPTKCMLCLYDVVVRLSPARPRPAKRTALPAGYHPRDFARGNRRCIYAEQVPYLIYCAYDGRLKNAIVARFLLCSISISRTARNIPDSGHRLASLTAVDLHIVLPFVVDHRPAVLHIMHSVPPTDRTKLVKYTELVAAHHPSPRLLYPVDAPQNHPKHWPGYSSLEHYDVSDS
jgi:hypothetical protein